MSRKRRIEGWKVYVLFIVIAGIIAGLIVLAIISSNQSKGYSEDLPPYSGEYSDRLRKLAEEYLSSNNPIYNSTIKYLFTKYYKTLYNTTTILNRTFTVKRNLSVEYVFKASRNETIIISTRGNGSYSYVLSLDQYGYYIIQGSGTPGNTSREFKFQLPEKFFYRAYIDVYLIVSSNSTKRVHGYIAVGKHPPRDLGTILKRTPVEFTVLTIYSWMKNSYEITDSSLSDIVENSRDPVYILENNVSRINSFEASLIMKKILDVFGIKSHIVAVDTNGDGRPDHFSLVIATFSNDPTKYSDNLMNILEGINRVGVLEGDNIHVKYIAYKGINWIIIDPVYELDYVPGQLTTTIYNVLGMII